MILVDYIAIGLVVLSGIIGSGAGLGKVLKFLAKGFVGVIISIGISYFLFGAVAEIGFVSYLMSRLVEAVSGMQSDLGAFLLSIHIDAVLLGIVLFIVVRLLVRLLAAILAGMFGGASAFARGVDGFFGSVAVIIIMMAIVLVLMSVVSVTTGGEGSALYKLLEGSYFRLDEIFLNNPVRIVYLSLAI